MSIEQLYTAVIQQLARFEPLRAVPHLSGLRACRRWLRALQRDGAAHDST